MDDPTKIEKKALQILNKLPAFQDFMKKNSTWQDSSTFLITTVLQELQDYKQEMLCNN